MSATNIDELFKNAGLRSAYTLSGADYRRLRSPFLIYIWRRGEEALYIGLSQDALGRVVKHDRINAPEPVQDGDEIAFFEAGDKWFPAAAIEESLIEALLPRYNRQIRFGKRIVRETTGAKL